MDANSSPPRAGGRGGRTSGTAGAVWLRGPRTYRDSTLTSDRIIAEAIVLLDGEGAGRLTMRRLAEHLGVGPTTLYWHVKTKDDVIDLAVDAIFDEVSLPEPSSRWDDDVRALVLQWRATMLRHPWAAGLLGRPLLGPNVLERTEFLQATLRRAGFEGPVLAAATHGLANYVIGSAATQSTWQHLATPELQQSADAHVRAHADLYPTLAVTHHLGEHDWDDLFRRGLEFMLAGLGSPA
ncbi:TetR/AcrR family transcriptional regulator [Sphaerisporangium sp. TRM90804]|uniref:TetR/AcrR family transcriptional regulator n=1 Tax=Sphaerisporangium sp. TRM90804 TaxID=3031113 RepID=UPI0024485993|nr:TetR/AcrR family transcriptional regulator [Sphaerisporangium sp. TRM90804]MDH2427313.1 TetR/AcrR family transcriptional regulator [Sphaerisporangium sp. TRM90804]